MARLAQFAVAFVLVTGVPAANAGLIKDAEIVAKAAKAAEDAEAAANAAKAAEDAAAAANAAKAVGETDTTAKVISAEANGVKVDTQVGGPGVQLNATALQAEVNGLKVENKMGNLGGGGGSGGDNHWQWLYALVLLASMAVGGWILLKPRRK
ncbi:hypothetical protein AB4Y36_03600 [Paraburkholderia sp. BR10936]|uniref:hypothetical protein n=1 Tax=Paraburkholderia sp. BR10936 TaxID=3236993 RepID=UPI0034D348C4